MLTAQLPSDVPEAHNDALQNELVYCEGLKTSIYEDTKHNLTGAIGYNFTGNGIPEFVVVLLYNYSIYITITDLNNDYPWWRGLDPVRQRAMINLMFNMGPSVFAEFKQFLLAMQEGRFSDAAMHLQYRDETKTVETPWYTQVGQRGPMIVDMINSGIAPKVPLATWPRP